MLNITPPAVHERVIRSVLSSGRHVFTEKPLTTTLESARDVLAFAKERGLQLGVAPDWFLGATGRTARAAIAAGQIGEPVAASAFITSSNVEAWHANPTSFYRPGAGPIFDLGRYYVSSLVDCLGPVASVVALDPSGSFLFVTDRPRIRASGPASCRLSAVPRVRRLQPLETPSRDLSEPGSARA